MSSKEKRIIVLSNLKSQNFEQAFFVLRDGCEESRSAVFEAERIVEEYIFPSSPPKRKRPHSRPSIPEFLPFAITAAAAILVGAAAIVINIL